MMQKPLPPRTTSMRQLLLMTATFLLASGCASHEDPDGSTPKPPVQPVEPEVPDADPIAEPPPPEEPAEPAVRVALSSVQLHQDCPDPEPEAGAAKPAAPASVRPEPQGDMPKPSPAKSRAKRAKPTSPGFAPSARRSCTQSTMQLSFTSETEGVVTVAVKEARLVLVDDKSVLGTLKTRMPTAWDDTDGYKAWDEALPRGALKASYKLGGPDWIGVESKLGGTSFGRMYMLEVDVDLGGTVQTVRSTEFTRERPHRVVT